MSKLRLPYNGESVPRGSRLYLTDHQHRQLDELFQACENFQDRTYPLKKLPKLVGVSVRNNTQDPRVKEINQKVKQVFDNVPVKFVEFKKSLPCHRERENILQCIRDNQVVVISGETGCGKTTQVPQYILEHAAARDDVSGVNIVCTQPRRVAAISVAQRVATETGTRLGDMVGYSVRHDSLPPSWAASVLFCTTGVLVKRLESDTQLLSFSHIIIDEIHERDVMADILLVLIKQILPKRPNLKVILMSATLDASKFSTYMNNCASLHVPGFMFPVHENFLEDVLEMTNYKFDSHISVNDTNNNQKLAMTENEVDQLSTTKELSDNTKSGLVHPHSETLNLDLVVETVTWIHNR